MIPKASQRGGGQQLATHLLNRYDNDALAVMDLRHCIAQDLHGAFAEWRAVASQTNCKKYLYSMSVNPDDAQRPLTRDEYFDYLDRVERKLGLANQPRAVVKHVKHGREHYHCVWSRIDDSRPKLKSIQISHDVPKLRVVTIEFAHDHSLQLPEGYFKPRTKEERKQQRQNLGEKQQEERTGETKDERMAACTEAWRVSDDAGSFVRALEERGYLLAKGDQKEYVVVDRFGEIHGLTRQIKGVGARQLRARLSSLAIDSLPHCGEAQDYARAQRRKQKTQDHDKAAALRRQALALSHKQRRDELALKKQALEARHQEERDALADAHMAAIRGVASERALKRPKGIWDFLHRITGIRAITEMIQRRQDRSRAGEQREQTEALKRRHAREMEDFAHREDALHKVEVRERQSLETALQREAMRAAAPVPELDKHLKAQAKKDRQLRDRDHDPERER